VVFKIKKDRMYLSVPEGDKKMRPYEVVAQEPTNPSGESASAGST
jgi:hypothetical protein